MRIILLLFFIALLSCKTNKKENQQALQKVVPITTTSTKAKEHFEKARFLVQNGINGNPIEHYQKAIELDSTFVRMYNFIAMYSRNDSVKRANHKLAKQYKHLASKEEQLLVEANEYRLQYPNDVYEAKLFQLAKNCSADKYLYHSICFLLFRKNPALAIKAGKKSVEIDTNYGSGYNILGYAYINNNELDKANEAFDNFIRCEPNNANPYDSKADLMKKIGNYKEALKLKKKAYQLDKSFDWIPEEIISLEAKIDSLKIK